MTTRKKGNSFTYIGPHDEVEVRDPETGLRLIAERDGAPIVVSDSLAAGLLEQTLAWKLVAEKAPAKPKLKAKPKAATPAPAAEPVVETDEEATT